MTVSTEVNQASYTGNGVTTVFPYTFRILKENNLTVTVINLQEDETVLALGTDYTVTGAGSYNGGAVTLPQPLASGYSIVIERDLAVVQETDLRNQGTFFAEVHEDAFDYLTMLIQQALSWLGLSLRRPTTKSKFYDAKQYRIANLADPLNDQDAVNTRSMRTYVEKMIAGVAGGFGWFIQSGIGAIYRTFQDKMRDSVSVKDFGVKADGITNDTVAFQNALNSGFTSFDMPDGVIVLNSGLVYSGKPLRLRGKGTGSTFLKFLDTSNHGIHMSALNHTDYFDIGDFTIIPVTSPVAAKNAIWIDGSSQPDPNDLYNGIPTTGHRETKRGVIDNINVSPFNRATSGFDRGIRVTSLLNYSISDCCVSGPLSKASEAYAIDGAGVCVDISLRNTDAYNMVTALMLPDYSEAIYLSEHEFVNVDTGILENYVSGRSVLLESQCGSNAHKIGPGHINAYIHAMFMVRSHFIKISKCLIINNLQNNPSNTSGIWITATNWPSVTDCMFFSPTGRPANMYGIVGDSVTNGQFHDNNFQNYPVGYNVLATSLYNNFSNSICYYNSAAVCVNLNASTVRGNSITNCTSDGTRYTDNGTGTRFQMLGIAKQGSLVVSVAASTVTVNVAVGSGAFSIKPIFAKMEALGNTQIQYHYDYSASTPTNLVFYGTLPSGSTIATGTYPYTVMACNAS